MLKKKNKSLYIGISIPLLAGLISLLAIILSDYYLNPYMWEPADLYFSLGYQITVGHIFIAVLGAAWISIKVFFVLITKSNRYPSTDFSKGILIGAILALINPIKYCQENVTTKCHSPVPFGLQIWGKPSATLNRRHFIFGKLVKVIEAAKIDLDHFPSERQVKEDVKKYWLGDLASLWKDPWGSDISYTSTIDNFTLISPGPNNEVLYDHQIAIESRWTPELFFKEIFDIDNQHLTKIRSRSY